MCKSIIHDSSVERITMLKESISCTCMKMIESFITASIKQTSQSSNLAARFTFRIRIIAVTLFTNLTFHLDRLWRLLFKLLPLMLVC